MWLFKVHLQGVQEKRITYGYAPMFQRLQTYQPIFIPLSFAICQVCKFWSYNKLTNNKLTNIYNYFNVKFTKMRVLSHLHLRPAI